MEVRLRATANFDYEQVAACNISISVVDSQEISQGTWVKLSFPRIVSSNERFIMNS